MSFRHAVCDKNGKVVNVVIWDGESPWKPNDPTHYVVRHDKCDIGDQHNKEIRDGKQTHSFIKQYK